MSIKKTKDTVTDRDKWFCVLLVENNSKWNYEIAQICRLLHTGTANKKFLCTHTWLEKQLHEWSKKSNINKPVMVRIPKLSATNDDQYDCRSSRAVAIFELYEAAQKYIDESKAKKKRPHIAKNLNHTPVSIKISKAEFSKLRKESDSQIAKEAKKQASENKKKALEKNQAELKAWIVDNESDEEDSTLALSSISDSTKDQQDKNILGKASGAESFVEVASHSELTSHPDRTSVIKMRTKSTETVIETLTSLQYGDRNSDEPEDRDENTKIIETELEPIHAPTINTNDNTAKSLEIQLKGKTAFKDKNKISQAPKNVNVSADSPSQTVTPKNPKPFKKVRRIEMNNGKMNGTTSAVNVNTVTDVGTSSNSICTSRQSFAAGTGTSQTEQTNLSKDSSQQTITVETSNRMIKTKRKLFPPEEPAKKTKSTSKAASMTEGPRSVTPKNQKEVKSVSQKQFTTAMLTINNKLNLIINATNQSTIDELRDNDRYEISHDKDEEGKVTLPCGEKVIHSFIMEAKDTSSQSRRLKKIMSAMWSQSELGTYILKHRGVQTEATDCTIMPQTYIERIKKVYDFLRVKYPINEQETFEKKHRSWISEKLRQCRQYNDPAKREKIRNSQMLASQKFKSKKKKMSEKENESKRDDGFDESSSIEDNDNEAKTMEERAKEVINMMIKTNYDYRTAKASAPITASTLAVTLGVEIDAIEELTHCCLKTKTTQGVDCYRLINAECELNALSLMLENISEKSKESNVTNLLECATLQQICTKGKHRMNPKMISYILSKYMDTDSSGRLYIPRNSFIARGIVYYLLDEFQRNDNVCPTLSDVLTFCRSTVFCQDMSVDDWTTIIFEYANTEANDTTETVLIKLKENKKWELDAEMLFRENLKKLLSNKQ